MYSDGHQEAWWSCVLLFDADVQMVLCMVVYLDVRSKTCAQDPVVGDSTCR